DRFRINRRTFKGRILEKLILALAFRCAGGAEGFVELRAGLDAAATVLRERVFLRQCLLRLYALLCRLRVDVLDLPAGGILGELREVAAFGATRRAALQHVTRCRVDRA